MYLGRFVIVTPSMGVYRVSSRSFPERKIVSRDEGEVLTVVPTAEAEPTDNPYVSYNCARVVGGSVVVGNGSHVDPITEKIGLGYPARDALVLGLVALDYEKDSYNTPRIAGVVGESAYIGIVREDAVVVEAVSEPTLVATYEKDRPEPIEFSPESVEGAAVEAMAMPYEHAICAAAVTPEDGWTTAVANSTDT